VQLQPHLCPALLHFDQVRQQRVHLVGPAGDSAVHLRGIPLL
jgi:hypothetical protein